MTVSLKCVFSLVVIVLASALPLSLPSAMAWAGEPSVAMPPLKCEIRQRAWCIRQEDSIITDVGAWLQTDPDHTWLIHHRDHPSSDLVILEPRGCRMALAETVTALRTTHGVVADGKTWDEAVVRLRNDGTCDLTLRVPSAGHDPVEWPYATGRLLLVACKDDACTPMSPTIADVTSGLRKK